MSDQRDFNGCAGFILLQEKLKGLRQQEENCRVLMKEEIAELNTGLSTVTRLLQMEKKIKVKNGVWREISMDEAVKDLWENNHKLDEKIESLSVKIDKSLEPYQEITSLIKAIKWLAKNARWLFIVFIIPVLTVFLDKFYRIIIGLLASIK